MTDFDFDVMERKRVAHSAKYRKYGSKSKRCPLSTDHMSNKQWKERCGEVITYPMNKPMRWSEFKNMPFDLQHEYIFRLIEKYNVNYTSLAEMFGVISVTVSNYFKTNGFGVSFGCGSKMSAAERDLWHRFLNGETEVDESPDEDTTEDNQQEEHITANGWCANAATFGDLAKPLAESEGNMSVSNMGMNRFSLQFSGKIDIAGISNSLYRILGENSVGKIDIEFTADS